MNNPNTERKTEQNGEEVQERANELQANESNIRLATGLRAGVVLDPDVVDLGSLVGVKTK